MTTIDPNEIENFSQYSKEWWDENGPLKGLHELNPVRLQFIKHHLCQFFRKEESSDSPFKGLHFCDLGCGGGLLTEPLARLGAEVTGVDASPEAIQAAQEHAKLMGLSIDYRACDGADLAKSGEQFDAVLSLEVVEHVANVEDYLQLCSDLTKPKGALILSTLNKTWKSWALGIVVAENVLKWAPKGAHDWNKFLSPEALGEQLRNEGLEPLAVEGMAYCPFKGWALSPDIDINYLLMARKG